MTYKGYIYKYTFPNGKVYIGQTRQSVERRFQEHIADSKHLDTCSLCELAIAKYGRPQVEVLATFEHENVEKLTNKLNKEEEKQIKVYNSTDSQFGYNVKLGGETKTAEQFILEEKWYEIFEKENWNEKLSYLKFTLESIRNKVLRTKEKLTKEENAIWYGYKFTDVITGKPTTFSSQFNIKKYQTTGYYDPEFCFEEYVMERSFGTIVDSIREDIWNKVLKKKEKIINDWFRGIPGTK